MVISLSSIFDNKTETTKAHLVPILTSRSSIFFP